MTRLDTELQRLYLPPGAQPAPGDAPLELALPDARVRAMVLGVEGPGAWADLGRVWQAVQARLSLPAPAIAVSGRGGFQLWFSLARPVPLGQASAFLAALVREYLAQRPAHQVLRVPATPDTSSARVDRVPAQQSGTECWSAFVAPDLAPVFADEPWLDLPPGVDAQAELLGRMACTDAAAFEAACAQLAGPPATSAVPAPSPPSPPPPAASTGRSPQDGARAFLLSVMRDAEAPLHLRIEAAKALLPWDETQPGA